MDMDKLEPSYIAHGNVKGCSLFGKQMAVSENIVTIWQLNSYHINQ